jgi:RNA polymerase sigma factor (sigma-70 family)
MRPEADITDLIARARTGDEEAIGQLLTAFGEELRIMVRARLPRTLRTRFDSTDFVQAVWQSFFFELRDRPLEFANVHHLRGFLSGVVRNKIYEQHRRLTKTAKYALGREERLYVRRGGREIGRDFVSPEPTPSQTVQASDRMAQLVAGCTPREVQVITLRYQGMTFEEIAARTGLGERTVRRVIEEVRRRVEARK